MSWKKRKSPLIATCSLCYHKSSPQTPSCLRSARYTRSLRADCGGLPKQSSNSCLERPQEHQNGADPSCLQTRGVTLSFHAQTRCHLHEAICDCILRLASQEGLQRTNERLKIKHFILSSDSGLSTLMRSLISPCLPICLDHNDCRMGERRPREGK